MPLSAARSYAKVLGVSLRDISERWAKEVGDDSQDNKTKQGKQSRKFVQRLCDIADSINDLGLMYLIGKAEEVAKAHPFAPPTKRGEGCVISMTERRSRSIHASLFGGN